MKILLIIIGFSLYGLATAVDTNQFVYLYSSTNPDTFFVEDINPSGNNDNLQLYAQQSNCLPGINRQRNSRFIGGHLLSVSLLAGFVQNSNNNPNRPYYLYAINGQADWYGLAESLRDTYIRNHLQPGTRRDIEQLVSLYRNSHSLIHNGPIDRRFIYYARPIINGLVDSVIFNQNYSAVGEVAHDLFDRIYTPFNRAYIESRSITVAQQNNQTQLACQAQNLCYEPSARLLMTPTTSPMCMDMTFTEIPVSQYLAGKWLPILFDFSA